MFADDDLPTPKPKFTPIPLERLGVEELTAYIAELRLEIERADAEIARKRKVRSAADTFFKFN